MVLGVVHPQAMDDKKDDRKRVEADSKEKVVDGSSSVGEEGVKVSLEEKRLMRRFDEHVPPMPISCILLLVSFLQIYCDICTYVHDSPRSMKPKQLSPAGLSHDSP